MAEPGDTPAPGQIFEVRVTPNASRAQVAWDGTRFQIRVTCPPEDGKANEAVRVLLAKHLRVAKTRLELVRGARSRDKTFRFS